VAGILRNLGVAHGDLDDDPTTANTGARNFTFNPGGGAQDYDLTNETAGANNLPGFAQVKSLANNPLTNAA